MGVIAGSIERRLLRVGGVVQGVGFRPTVYALARDLQLTGFVNNDTFGVHIEIEGGTAQLDSFIERLPRELPPMARISQLEVTPLEIRKDETFSITASNARGALVAAVTPDAHLCDDCLRELGNPADRRFRYPFINCTNCGPRYTIVRSIPYDRPNTTMAAFPMCERCRREYEDPRDRRFHAQPVACPVCGPSVTLCQNNGEPLARGDDAVLEAREALLRGQILAIKGIGGFHLAVDATSKAGVEELRRRKGREQGKPFALMVRNLERARELVHLDEAETEALTRTARPIVLARKKRTPTGEGGDPIAEGVAPSLRHLGVMLPYTPLHHLLLEPPMPPLVMTSGNPTSEPLTTTNKDALERLSSLCDALLLHNRDIQTACDDSVVQVIDGEPLLLRRARGFVPQPLLPTAPPVAGAILALGGEMKAAICLTRPGQLVLGRHLGDVDNIRSQEGLREEQRALSRLIDVEPELVVHDLHPDYFTTRLARELADERSLSTMAVQHHHAHFAACLAENDHPLDKAAIGVIFDGTGYGLDGTIWGGEILVGGYRRFESRCHLRPLALPGGDVAVRNPYRTALALLFDVFGEAALQLDLELFAGHERRHLEDLVKLVRSGLACPTSRGVGRLFDAVAAILALPGGLSTPVGYDAQPAIELEALANQAPEADSIEPYDINTASTSDELDHRPLVAAIVQDLRRGVDRATIAARFHASLTKLATDAVRPIAEAESLDTVALSGGCFNNALLLSGLTRHLEQLELEVLRHHDVPCNDGGLALGQAIVASACSTGAAPPREE